MADQIELTSNIAVFLRLRPLNKFESNRRSRSVVEVLDEKKLSIEDPSSGDLEFDCDGVFEQSCSQQQIYQDSCRNVPQQLLDGCNCLIAAYGPTGSGKSYTLLGNPLSDGSQLDGLIARAARDMFERVEKSDPSIEFTIRCSAVEVYLEKIRDLFVESSHVQVRPDGSFSGATALSCLSVDDVLNTIQRANAARTSSSHDSSRDSSRSTLIIRLQVEQFDGRTDTGKISKVDFVDLLGSEVAALAYSEEDTSEPSQLSFSLNYLHNQLKAEIDRQAQGVVTPPIPSDGAPLLAKLLTPCIGGIFFTTFILHASPSNYSVTETVNTIKFGQDCRKITNRPKVNLWCRWWDCHEKLNRSNERQERLIHLVNSLASGCQNLRDSRGANIGETNLWGVIRDVQWVSKENRPLDFRIESQKEHETELAKVRLKSDLRRAEKERDEAVALQRQLRSELVACQVENEQLQDTVSKLQQDLELLRNEKDSLELRKNEVEHNLRTSLFRESEAVVFLRQFRRFYFRLLQRTAAQGNGDLLLLGQRIPGAPDLTQLSGIDQMMVESGLLEEDEVGRDASTDPRPSRAALIRSTAAAEQAETRAIEEAEAKQIEREELEKTLIDQTQLPPPTSIIKRSETGEMVEARQRLYETPSGRYLVMREKILEEELLNMSERCMQLQKELHEERINVEALTGRTGVAAAFDKMRIAQETRALKEQLEKKENDLKTVIWALNEERMAKKIFQEKLDDRERHITYLEENLSDIQMKMSVTETEKQEVAKKLREEILQLKQRIAGLSKVGWHFSSSSVASQPQDSVPPIRSRLVVPFSITSDLNEPIRRDSVGDPGEWIDLALSRSLYKVTLLNHPEGSPASASELGKGEHEFRKKVERAVSFSDSLQVTETVISSSDRDIRDDGVESEAESEESGDHDDVDTSPKRSIMDDMFFMDDEETKRGQRTVLHSYDGIVDAYKSVSLNTISKAKTLPERKELSSVEQTPHSEPALTVGENELITQDRSLDLHRKSPDDGVAVANKSKLKSGLKKTDARKGTSLSGFMDRLRAKAKHIEDDEKSATPEFMKKFRTIGAKNHAESVIETAGSAPAQEATRTLYGESLKHNTEKRVPDVTSTYQNTNKWTPRKKSEDDNDDDSFAREFLKGAVNMSSTLPDNSNSSEEMTDEHMFPQHGVNRVEYDPPETRLPGNSTVQRSEVDSDSESSDESALSKPVKVSLPAQALSVARAKNTSLGPRSVDSDTGSSEDESTVVPTARQSVAVTQSASLTTRNAPSSRQNTTSHSGSLDDESTIGKSSKVSLPATALSSSQSKLARHGPCSVDSESSEDESTVAPATIASSPAISSLIKKTVASQRKVDSDSDSDSDSSEDASYLRKPAKASLSPATMHSEKAGCGPRSVDSDSSEDESTVAQTASTPSPVSTSLVGKSAGLQGKADCASDSDSDSESSEDGPTHGVSPRTAISVSPAKKSLHVKDNSSSDSESSEDESTVSPTTNPFRAHNGSAAVVRRPMNAANKSKSDSESSDDESTVVPVPKTAQTGTARTPVAAKKPVQRQQREESDSDSSSDESSVAKPASPPIIRANRSGNAHSRDESDSTDSSDLSTGERKIENVGATTKRSPEAESESDSSGEETSQHAGTTGLRKHSLAREKSVDSSDTEGSEEASIAIPNNQQHQTSQADPRSDTVLKTHRADPDDDSENSSVMEFGSNSDRKQTKQEDLSHEMQSNVKVTNDDSSSYEEEVIDESVEGNEIIDLTNHEEGSTRYTPPRTLSSLGREADNAFAEIRAKQNAARNSPKPQTNSASSVEISKSGSRELAVAEDAFVGDAFSSTPFFPEQSTLNSKEPDAEIQMFLGGKTADYQPRRTVPDFGSQITPGVTSGSSTTGGKKKKQSSSKTKFVIKGGKLVKSDSSQCDAVELSEVKNGKTKFVIRDGKLVKDDSGLGATLSSMDRLAKSNKQGRRMSLDSRTDDCDFEMRESRRHELTLKEPRRASMQMNASGPAQRPKQLRRSSFVIMNGKLVKQEEARPAPPPSPAKAASFSIVGGKLVKTESSDVSKKDKSKKKAKSGESKDKKKEKKKKTKERRPSI